jgi:hypothetical protein
MLLFLIPKSFRPATSWVGVGDILVQSVRVALGLSQFLLAIEDSIK